MQVKFDSCGRFPCWTGVMTFGDVRSCPLSFGLSRFMCRMELPDREQSCATELMVLWAVKKPSVDCFFFQTFHNTLIDLKYTEC